MDARQAIAKRLKEARERLGITQDDLAKQVGIQNRQTIGEIEKGTREIKAWELVELANALHLDINHLLLNPSQEPAKVLWRDVTEASAPDVEAEFLKRCSQYYELEQLCDLEKAKEFPRTEADPVSFSERDAEELARECQRDFDLGSFPADSLLSVLENRYRVKIWYESLSGRGSAAASRGPFGCAILMNADEAPWRRNFNFAHEVFHLITWGCFAPALLESNAEMKAKAEKFADVFAARLLMPAEGFESAVEARIDKGKISYLSLVELARRFDVSTTALLIRMKDARFIASTEVSRILSDRHFKQLDTRSMPEKWWTPPRMPPRFVNLAFFAYKSGRLSRLMCADLLGVKLAGLDDVIRQYDLPESDSLDTRIPITCDPTGDDEGEASVPAP